MSEKQQLILTALILFGAYYLVKKILLNFGLIEDPKEKEAYEQFMAGANSNFRPFKALFTPDLYSEVINELSVEKKASFVNMATVRSTSGIYEALCSQILNSKRLVNDDEEQLFSAFAQIGSIHELWFFCFYWKQWCVNNSSSILINNLEYADNIKIMGNFLANDFLSKGDILKFKRLLNKLKNY